MAGAGRSAATEGMVETLLSDIRAMAIDFRLKPGQRVNEVALSKRLNASRTPLREALNRLVAEGFLTFESGRGFSCRRYTVGEVQNLYQLRQAIERFCVQHAASAPDPERIDALAGFLDRTAGDDGRSLEELLACDEHFHETVAGWTGNDEILRTLRNLNARIRFFRWIDMEARRDRTQGEHRAILGAIAGRDPQQAARLIDGHIERRRDEIAEAVKECHARLFVEDDFVSPSFKTVEDLCA